jgi:cysteine-rich secretory family protein
MSTRVLFVVLLCCVMYSPTQAQSGSPVYKDPAFIDAILQQHNVYRSALHLPPLSWSPELALDALAWGKNLASDNKMKHDFSIRGKEGENLFTGTAGAYSPTEMVSFWGNEKKDFVYGTFPDCATSRSAVVGHYTQVIWKTTTVVGCALVSNGKLDYLVCRYAQPGNMVGQKPY